jgi:hypothetical protein
MAKQVIEYAGIQVGIIVPDGAGVGSLPSNTRSTISTNSALHPRRMFCVPSTL